MIEMDDLSAIWHGHPSPGTVVSGDLPRIWGTMDLFGEITGEYFHTIIGEAKSLIETGIVVSLYIASTFNILKLITPATVAQKFIQATNTAKNYIATLIRKREEE